MRYRVAPGFPDHLQTMRPFKIPESVLVVMYTPALDVLLIRRADAPDFWQSVTGSKDTPTTPVRPAAAIAAINTIFALFIVDPAAVIRLRRIVPAPTALIIGRRRTAGFRLPTASEPEVKGSSPLRL